jgi:hypothetical protein
MLDSDHVMRAAPGDQVIRVRALSVQSALDPDTRRADLRAWQIEYQTLPPEVYPNTAAIAHCCPRSTTRATSPPQWTS